MMWVITESYRHAASSFFAARFARLLEELLVSPLPDWIVVAGFVIGGMIRGFLVGTVVALVALLFTNLHVQHCFATIAVLLLTSAVSALGGFINAMFAKNPDGVNWIPTLVLTPLTYVGGVFFSVSMLPDWAQKLSFANPIFYMVNAFRFGFLGVPDVHIGMAFSIVSIIGLVLFASAGVLMSRGTGIRG